MSTSDNAAMATAIANTQKETFGAQVVAQTLDTLNKTAPKGKSKTGGGNMAASYDFQKSVLSAVYSPKGAIAEIKS